MASGPSEAPYNPAALEEGLQNSIGDSVSGVHKGLPASATSNRARKHPAAQPSIGGNPKGTKYHERTGEDAREEGLAKEGFRLVAKK